MNVERSLVPLKRKCEGSRGTPFLAYVNYFKIPGELQELQFIQYKVDISYERIDKGGIIDESKQILNRSLRREVFWRLCNYHGLVVFNDWQEAFVSGSREQPWINRSIPLGKGKNVFVLIKPFSRPFSISLTDQNVLTAQLSEILLKTLVTQGTRTCKESGNFFSHGGSVFPIPLKTESAWDVKIHNDIRAWVGLYAGVRNLRNTDLVINFALTHKLFRQMNIDLVTFFVEVLHSIDEGKGPDWYKKNLANLSIRPEHIKRLNEGLKGLKVRVKKEGKPAVDIDKRGPCLVLRHGCVRNVSNQTAKSFIVRGHGSLEEIYAKMNVTLDFPYLPIIEVQCQKRCLFIPMEILYTYDTPTTYTNCFKYFMEQKRYIERVSHSPTEYAGILLRAVNEFSEKGKEYGYGMGAVEPKLLEVQGRCLKRPVLLAGDATIVKFHDDYTYRVKELNKCPEQEIYFSLIHVIENISPDDGEKMKKTIKTFYDNLKPRLIERGLKVSDAVPIIYTISVSSQSNTTINEVAEFQEQQYIRDFGKNFREQIAPLFLVIFEDIKTQYGRVKVVLDRDYGFASQGIDESTVRITVENTNTMRSVYYNLALKINAKLGGVNIDAKNVQFNGNKNEEKLMYIGIDCTHPSDEIMGISLAAMTGSIDNSGVKYTTEVYAHLTGKEQVDYFHQQFKNLLFSYYEANEYYPEHIVVYRDGVSNSQLIEVAAHELQSMRDVWNTLQGNSRLAKPTFTYIVLQKRHGTRFFLPGKSSNEYQNVEPGSVFDGEIASPNFFDFWLCSQYSERHTIRPGHYIVVHDDWKLEPDDIYKMTYRLCFLNARCRKPISLPVPIHYADIACSKLREKYKALIETRKLDPKMENIEMKRCIEKALKIHDSYPGMPYI